MSSARDLVPEPEEIRPLRLQLVAASGAAGIAATVAPTTTAFRDVEPFRTSPALLALRFRGRTGVHPSQVRVANEVVTPGVQRVTAARAVVARFEQASSGVFVDETGRMADIAVVRSARKTLARVRRLPQGILR